MKRAGFTMIELIFVIVILGILSAVALPKFIGVSEQAEAGKCKAFVGTLNRTVLPALWSDAILNKSGFLATTDFSSTLIQNQIAIPDQCGSANDYAAAIRVQTAASTFAGGTQKDLTIGNATYRIDDNVTASRNESPVLSWIKQ